MSRLLVLGMLPLAALSASEGAKGADALSVATKAESGAPSRGLFATRNKDEQNNGGQRLRGPGWWSGANAQNAETGLLQARHLQTTGCGDGIAGVRSSDGDGFICCAEECGVCGGEGCSSAGGEGFDGSDCCVSTIAASGRFCSETGEAPCIMEEAAGCGNGIAGIRSEDGTGDVCCVEECGVCGGAGCASAAGEGFDNTHCCVSAILAAGQTCDVTGAAPCLLGGVPGDKDGDGGIDGFAFRGCYVVEGSNPFSEIIEDGAMTPELCFDTCARKSSLYMGLLKGNECGCGEDPSFLATDQVDGVCDEPCPGDEVQTCGGALAYDLFELMDDDPTDDFVGEDSTCDGGIPGVQSANGNVCCQTACGICDGSSCVGFGDCCEEKIQGSGVLCSDSGSAPCILDSDPNDDVDRTSPDGTEMTGFLHVGCYAESSFDPFTFVTQINFMTIRLCSERCGSMGADYAGLMDGDVCGCGSEPGYIEAEKVDGVCLVECAGDDGRTEICGGETSFVLIQIIYSGMAVVTNTANTIAAPTPTPAPELVAQLNSDAAGAVVTAPGDAPAGSDAAPLTAYTHLGCFGFEVANNPFFSLVQMAGMTYHMCSEACGALGAVYIGAFDGDMCGCGSKAGYLLEQKPAGTCDALCVGDAAGTDTCGGSVSFDLLLINYLATDDDYFGPDSAAITPGVSTSGGLEEGSVPQSDGDTTDDVDSTTDFETGQVETVVAPMAGYEYAGCFEMEPTLDPFSSLIQMDNMTLDTCTAFCGASGATYAAVMNGDMCGCGSDAGYLASDKDAGLCLVECAGDGGQVEMCGGSSSFGLFEILYVEVAEDGTSDGSASSTGPADTSGIAFANDEMTGYIYEGCYQIDASFDPFSSLSQINLMTPRSCNEMCGSLGADYAGAMDGDLCGCGTAANYLEADKQDGECSMECTGDDGRTEMCGGSAAFDLYRIFYSESDDAGGR